MRADIRAGVRRLFRLPIDDRQRSHADADAELEAVLSARIDQLVAQGLAPHDARVEALRRLSHLSLTDVRRRLRGSAARREHRMRLRDWLESIAGDLRFGARQLRRTPGVAITTVLSLGIGIGANSAIFAVVNAILLRPLPVERPNELVAVGRTTSIGGHTGGAPRADLLSLPTYDDIRRDTRLVTGLAASGTAGELDVRIPGAADGSGTFEHPNGRFVSANYFSVLRVPAERGRMFDAEEAGAPGRSPVAVISDRYWRQRLAATPDVLGARIEVDGTMLTVVGVAQRGFDGDIVERPTDIWLPISMQPIIQPHSAPITDRGTSWLLAIGRLAPGVTLAQARAGYTSLIHASLVASASSAGDATNLSHLPVFVTSGAQGFSAARVNFKSALVTLQVAVALLLVVVCVNVANLLLGRAATRATEMSVRLALGASRRRLVRQLVTEALFLAVLGAGLAMLVARWGSVALERAAGAADMPAGIGGIDATVMVFSVVVSLLAAVGFGVAPALRLSRVDLASSMRAGARSIMSSRRGGRVPIGALLVPLQIAFCVILLTGATLLTRSLRRVEARDSGLDRDHLIVAELDVARRGLTGDRFMAEARELDARLAALPGVRAVTFSENGLFIGRGANAIVAVPGFAARTQDDSSLTYDLVGPGYIHAIGGRLLRGRDISDHDVRGSPNVAVINESAARFYFGSVDAIGHVIYFDAGVPTTVVGVVADIRDRSLVSLVDRQAWVPYAQQIADESHPFLAIEVRAAGDPAALVGAVRRAITATDPELPQRTVAPLVALMHVTIRDQRLVSTLAVGFGVAALLMALIGLYGVMSYAVTRRTAEFGLRSALGATFSDVMRLVLADGVRLASVGIAVGAPAALLVAEALRSQLHGVPATDPVSLGAAVVAIGACAIAVASLPALRAARVSPSVALAMSS